MTNPQITIQIMDLCFSEENLKWLRTYLRETKSHSLLIVTNERTNKSIHPPYHMHISARDMAKIGLLMLNNGEYKGKQLISRKWVKKMTTMKTKPRETGKRGVGYGYMWWVFANDRHKGGVLEGAYSARGMGNQWLLVVPKLGSVVVMKRKYDPFEANRVVHQLFG